MMNIQIERLIQAAEGVAASLEKLSEAKAPDPVAPDVDGDSAKDVLISIWGVLDDKLQQQNDVLKIMTGVQDAVVEQLKILIQVLADAQWSRTNPLSAKDSVRECEEIEEQDRKFEEEGNYLDN